MIDDRVGQEGADAFARGASVSGAGASGAQPSGAEAAGAEASAAEASGTEASGAKVPPSSSPGTVSLIGGNVILRPITANDGPAIVAATQAHNLSDNRWTSIPTANDIDSYLARALEGVAAGHTLAFVTTLADTGQVVGASRFWRYEPANRKLEIGHTWVAADWQRSFVNTEAKYLMLRYAFEHLACLRVEFQTDELNAVSRQAILRLGATFEGIARKERIMPDGRQRNTARFAIVDDDWPRVRDGLESRIRRAGGVPSLVVQSLSRNGIRIESR
ncbi:GNAT family N-acetyltransferase [Pigmentiphaga litoralis]|uniref:GNAT family N-acetyltransferase n=1 Tax=Pigmentiphaga litoralis TaxID=516702 RepID=UPI003B43523C